MAVADRAADCAALSCFFPRLRGDRHALVAQDRRPLMIRNFTISFALALDGLFMLLVSLMFLFDL